MPIIIPNLQEKILDAARQHLLSEGYRNMKIRTIANECGIALGTIYNYYQDKDALVQAAWESYKESILNTCRMFADQSEYFTDAMITIYSKMRNFNYNYRQAFETEQGKNSCSEICGDWKNNYQDVFERSVEYASRKFHKHTEPAMINIYADALASACRYDNVDNMAVEKITQDIFGK